MGLWAAVTRWRDERNKLAELRANLHDADVAENDGDYSWYRDLIDQIETRRRIRAAWRFGVPIPQKPRNSVSDKYWDWCFPLGEHHLTIEGHAYLRREIAHERELLYKPWLSWLALGISLFGLLVSILVAIFK